MTRWRHLPNPILLASLLASLLGLAACANAPLHDATYVLKPEQSLELAPGLTLTYDSFSDSRCPANAKCIWAGRLAFRFIVQGKNGNEEFTLGPDQPVAAPAALHGARVTLDLASVPPARIAAARPQDLLPVTLTISAR
jgi:uncharacterized cupredoxin-like copper-binding protein